ncbi:MAG: UDP-N-acetylmuramoyl-tripeptide--D-alanyl-D-alanine ligase [Candidatus Paceibacterota bacterium]|nr:UDP-N-acetylmuramoyl-tripeptide--D-alanyl-D-alanine ligase [Candidatus Paceibacterota bacterium]MDD3072210.1 UDP-N-acetylmuramoyl-tripeptide--D-alanyl-D-alanine ligase [Candidatus Paceibacterota bacterium]MDD4201167.1 UDP-N-acetylmuramoyl-tripeptide--D-alanyl-D-alanine ligase [Candidatus Paceibacterota bacterium]MDD4897256.1 UDP-N-acetylmuramoyl-tripeptide--D-alanyl-D-alanine ligase [Candidatus Paceibacterota bacterium]
MNYLIGFLWFFRAAKTFAFYVYLWQIKEYHLGRFRAHFETKEGKKLIFNRFILIKVFLLLFFFISFIRIFFYLFVFLLFLLYIIEFLKLSRDAFKKSLKLPIFTLKASFLFGFLLLIQTLFFIFAFSKGSFLFYLLLFDVVSPLIASFIVLLFQPVAVFFRSRTLKKAKEKRESFSNLTSIGIVGSYGKTSTKEFLSAILSQKFNVLKTFGHVNSEIGISKTILDNLDSSYDIFVCEMGAYKKGGIEMLSDIAKPKIGILTGINQQHLSLFGTIENLLSAEGGEELFNSLPRGGLMIVNADSKRALKKYGNYIDSPPKKKTIHFSSAEKKEFSLDIWAEEIEEKEEELLFKACFKEGDFVFLKANLLGKQNIENLLLSILVSRKLGMSFEEIEKGISKIEPWQGGSSFLIKEEGYKVIDASYSANPSSVIALLDYLKVFSLRKTIVMPCLIELGSSARKIHKNIGKKIAEVCDLAIITSDDYLDEIKEGAGIKKNKILFMKNPDEIVSKIEKEKGVVLLKGRVNKKIISSLALKNNDIKK